MERGSNVNIPNFCKRTLSHYAVCNNNPQCIELWVQLGTAVNYQGPRYMCQCLMAVVIGSGIYLFYLNIFHCLMAVVIGSGIYLFYFNIFHCNMI
jgi:hypothetical protein